MKGQFAFDFIQNADRLKKPLVRRDDGELHEADWDEALEIAAQGFLRAKKNGIRGLNVYKNSQFEKSVSSSNLNLNVGQRVFHQKFGMGLIISSDGDKLNINFDKAGEKKVVSSFVKIIE